MSIWFSFVLWLITKGVKEKKRKGKEKVETGLMSRVQEAKGAKQHFVDLQTRNQIPRPYREEKLLEVNAIVIGGVSITTSASKQEIKACIAPGTSF